MSETEQLETFVNRSLAEEDLQKIALPTLTQQYIHISKYSRWDYEKERRETWYETAKRYIDFIAVRAAELGSPFSAEERHYYLAAILNLETMPSMRAMMSAGPAAAKDNAAMFNCTYMAFDNQRAFSELLYLSACSCGCGFSVERQEISQLPEIPAELRDSDTVIVFRDSKRGWAEGYQLIIDALYNGMVPKWDLSKIRPAGAPLKTFGGRASGPKPLDNLIKFTIATFRKAASEARNDNLRGRRLTSLEVHSIVCKIAEAIVSGGVRRSALISLSNLSDDRMRNAKTGQWWEQSPHFALANNSAAYTEKPDMDIFFEEWHSLFKSKSGERGIFNRRAVNIQAARTGRRAKYKAFGCNPCGEVNLRSQEMCNLSEVVARSSDSPTQLLEKARIAVLFGIIQSTFTDFRYLRGNWKSNCDEERLLGISITGIMDHPILNGSRGYATLQTLLTDMKSEVLRCCQELCERFDLNMPAATTLVKPSGTVSQLVNSSSGIHTRWSKLQVRRYQENTVSPVFRFLKEAGVPWEPLSTNPDSTAVFSFPVKAPDTAVVRADQTAIQQLELWMMYKLYWCEHNPSASIYVRDSDWLSVGAYVYENFDEISGLSFFPYDNGTYQQAPNEEITEEKYNELVGQFPQIDWRGLEFYEKEDMTTGSKELACSGPTGCEVL